MLEKSRKLWSQTASHVHTFAFPASGIGSDTSETAAAGRVRAANGNEPNVRDTHHGTMSMLEFYRNRAGRDLSAAEREHLEKAKTALRANGRDRTG